MKTFIHVRLRALNACGWFLESQGFQGVRRLGKGLGWLMWHALPKRRKLAVNNIVERLLLPRCTAKRLAKDSFCMNAQSFLEVGLTTSFGLHLASPTYLANAPHLLEKLPAAVLVPDYAKNPKNFRLHIAQPDLWNQLLTCPRPIVAATAHMGAWELLASVLGDMYSPPRPRMVVVRRYSDPAVQAFITKRREAHGATMVGHRTVAAMVLRALRDRGVVAFLVDHHSLNSESLHLPFLGQSANVNMGPALLAVRSQALVWPVFLLRKKGPNNRQDYELHIQAPLDTSLLEGNREEKVLYTARFYTQAVERIVQDFPEQWFWMHNRWKD